MTESEIIEKLTKAGYTKVWVYDAVPHEIDEEHSHDFDTKLHILSGEIRIKKLSGGEVNEYVVGKDEEIEIPRNQIHSAVVGAEGCRYIVAERHKA